MKRNFLPVLIIILLSFESRLYGQGDFLPGYIITLQGDTLEGVISDRKDASFPKLYKSVKFKGQGVFVRNYRPSKIVGYRKGHEDFVSVWYNSSYELFKEVHLSRENVGEKKFMKVKEAGYLTLYYLEYLDYDSQSIDYLPLFKRENQDYFVRATQGIFGLKKRSLSAYFEDCPELIDLINQGTITTPVEVVRFYNRFYHSL